ncbi:PilN domain-containing protein [Thermodesulforhabdus norvegica]|uniref:Type IV pilus assembly protein PilN n=1 Tax=Thermodesulforhabdus norvegica TaxID=39841 RepID=A0A1I4WD23_9BACT|nr:PilN domain-containing protein [Thermodesulforhabdus norvegica]SFN11140.1 type IV pilus assembly protein PilN [Thermodesulforhabdus norvegica]
MIRINLLREKVQKPPSVLWQLWVYLLTVVVVSGLVGYVGWNQKRQINSLTREKARIEREIKLYQKYDKLVKELEAKTAEIKRRSEIVKSLLNDRDYAVRALALIAVLTPSDSMWFETIQYNDGSLTLKGYAKSDEVIVDFIRRLEGSPYVLRDSVRLIRTKTDEYLGRALKSFEMEVKVLPFSQVVSGKGTGEKELSKR